MQMALYARGRLSLPYAGQTIAGTRRLCSVWTGNKGMNLGQPYFFLYSNNASIHLAALSNQFPVGKSQLTLYSMLVPASFLYFSMTFIHHLSEHVGGSYIFCLTTGTSTPFCAALACWLCAKQGHYTLCCNLYLRDTSFLL